MKRLSLLVFFCILLCACTPGEPVRGSYHIYYPTENHTFMDTALQSELYYPLITEPETEALISTLLARLLLPPESEGLRSVMPSGVSVLDWTLEEGVLQVDFSWQYGFLSGIDLTLADYSVTLTLSQIPGVEQVVTTVEGETLAHRQEKNLQSEQVLMTLQPPTDP